MVNVLAEWMSRAMADQEMNDDAGRPEEGGTATITAPTQKPSPPKHKPKKLPPYKVLLHNDDVNSFEHVIQ